jgi:hypothetical protein
LALLPSKQFTLLPNPKL